MCGFAVRKLLIYHQLSKEFDAMGGAFVRDSFLSRAR